MPRNKTQRGNVFFIILIAVALFAALAFTISRSMRSETTTAMSAKTAALAASDIMAYAQRLERAVDRLRSKGISESDIDFTNSVSIEDYSHTPALTAEYQIFGTGGGVTWQNPPKGSNDGTLWQFVPENCIADIGKGGAGCESDGVDNEEILLVLPNVDQTLCKEIDKRLGISPVPASGALTLSPYTGSGSFADGGVATGVDGKNAACFYDGSAYQFYYVLLAR